MENIYGGGQGNDKAPKKKPPPYAKVRDRYTKDQSLVERIKKVNASRVRKELLDIINGKSNYVGFLPLAEYWEYSPAAPAIQVVWKDYGGAPKLFRFDGHAVDADDRDLPTCRLILYRGIYKDDKNKDDGERYVYIVRTNANDVSCGDCYIRLVNLYERISGGEEAKSVIGNDRNAYFKQKSLLFYMWLENGAIAFNRMLELLRKLNPSNQDWLVSQGGGIDDQMLEQHFITWADIFRRSAGGKVNANDCYGRYWDYVIPKNCENLITNGFMIVFSDRVRDILIKKFGLMDDSLVFTFLNKLVQTAKAAKTKFQPKIDGKNVWFASGFEANVLAADPQGWQELEAHPGGLYTIWIDSGAYQVFMTQQVPFVWYSYPLPTKTNAEAVNTKMDTAGSMTLKKTCTFVSPQTIQGAYKKKRRPNQDGCMNGKGYSANRAMSVLWGYDPKMARKYRLGEWLHRSAFSFGGNPLGHLDILSTQTAHNLILGSRETNTVMMRYEAFIKRLVVHSTNGVQQGSVVTVETTFDYSKLGSGYNWMGEKEYCWLAPVLIYRYQNQAGFKPEINFTRRIYPFNRENCMLFQAVLDKVVEKVCWGWNTIGVDISDPNVVFDEFEQNVDYDEELDIYDGKADMVDDLGA